MSGLTNEKQIAKTVKLFIGGDFPRTESGRSFPIYKHKTKKVYAHICQASRKDLRNSVTAAQGALSGWSSRSAYNRGQILYRAAEMLEAKREECVQSLNETLGLTAAQANKSVDGAVDAFVYYAGFADKHQQLSGCVNPVSGPHHNFTTPEPVGVVGFMSDEKFDFARIVAQLSAIIVSGNTVVALLPEEGSALLAPLAETLATSDLPKGVVNLLTGYVTELATHFGSHMEIHSLSVQSKNKELLKEMTELAAANMKRIVKPTDRLLSLEHLNEYVEFKTIWHPIGN